MSIKKMTHANGTQTPDEIIVDYAIKDGDGNVISSTYAKSNDLATVATSGSYNDLTNKPTIPAGGTLFKGAAMSYYDGLFLLVTIPTGIQIGDFYLTTNADPTFSMFKVNDLFQITAFNTQFDTYEATKIGCIVTNEPGTLNTTMTTAQSTSASEALSGNIKLHKVSKTGTYSDLIGTPTISTAPTTGTGLWDANTIINYIASRGQQLMTNGTFLLASNYNFSTMTYDGSDANASGGCVYKIGASTAAKNDEYIAIDKTKLYRLTYDLKPNAGFDAGTNTSAGINGFLPYLDQYDIDKNLIADTNTNYKAGTLVQLTRELKAGDTTMEITDASAWTTFTSVNATMQIWDYTNSKGYTYGPGEYTRHTFNMGANSSASGNTITFQNAYSGATIPAGTWVSQNRGGGYAYIGSYDKPAAGVWTHCTHDTTASTVRGGCAFAKIGWLWNYNVSNNTATAYAAGDAVPLGRIIKYNNQYYFCIKEVPANSSILPSDTEYYDGPYAGVTNGIKTKMTNIQLTIKSLT